MNEFDKDLLDLGSDPVGEDFNPFEDAEDDTVDTTETVAATETNPAQEPTKVEPSAADEPKAESPTPETKAAEPTTSTEKKTDPKEPDSVGFADKQPVFEYAGATENIDDASKTFDELRIEKSTDFPELEDGKRVSWVVEYGKITKTVADPKGTSIGKMKSDIETSKEFEDSLKKRGADKNPACKIKPRVTAQSKGQAAAASYRGVFPNTDEAEAAGKIISIVPARDGKVYEIRNTEMGKFITPVVGCDLLSDVRAGFAPALPRIPSELVMKVLSFFRYYVYQGGDKEALVNVYWDKHAQEYTIDAPEQVVTKASVNSRISEKFTDDRYIHYMDIHSHNTMNAFFSDTDNRDEKATRLYTVVGKLNEYVPEIKTRISNGGKFLEIDPGEVFEHIGAIFPNEWKDNVRYRTPNGKAKADTTFFRLMMLKNKLMDGVGDYALCA